MCVCECECEWEWECGVGVGGCSLISSAPRKGLSDAPRLSALVGKEEGIRGWYPFLSLSVGFFFFFFGFKNERNEHRPYPNDRGVR